MATMHPTDSLSGPDTRPAGVTHGPGHLVDYGNPAFRSMFGDRAVGMPLRESMVGLPVEVFDLLDVVFREGRPLARWIHHDGEDWRLTAIPRRDVENDEVYGVAFHFRRRTDLPITRPD